MNTENYSKIDPLEEKIEILRNTVNEAYRFIERTKAAYRKLETLRGKKYRQSSIKEMSAARRSSMDLTRCLTVMRKEKS